MTKTQLEKANAQTISGEDAMIYLDENCAPYASMINFDVYADGVIGCLSSNLPPHAPVRPTEMTTSELNIPLSTSLADAMVRAGACKDLNDAKYLLTIGAVTANDLFLGPGNADYHVIEFVGQKIKVGARGSFDVVDEPIAPPESELDSLRRKFSELATRLRETQWSVDDPVFCDGLRSGSISAADAIEELLSTPYWETK